MFGISNLRQRPTNQSVDSFSNQTDARMETIASMHILTRMASTYNKPTGEDSLQPRPVTSTLTRMPEAQGADQDEDPEAYLVETQTSD